VSCQPLADVASGSKDHGAGGRPKRGEFSTAARLCFLPMPLCTCLRLSDPAGHIAPGDTVFTSLKAALMLPTCWTWRDGRKRSTALNFRTVPPRSGFLHGNVWNFFIVCACRVCDPAVARGFVVLSGEQDRLQSEQVVRTLSRELSTTSRK